MATAAYLYHREHVPLVARYLDEGNPPDQPGRLVAWLYPREPVYAYRFAGLWFDIGNPEQLLEADNRWRERVGLPPRETLLHAQLARGSHRRASAQTLRRAATYRGFRSSPTAST